MFSLNCSSVAWNRKQVFGLPNKSQEQRNVSKILEGEEIISLHISCYLHDDLASQFSPWLVKLADNRSLYQAAFVMESIYHFKSLQPAHFFTFPDHWAVTPRPCLWKQEINALTLCISGSSPAARRPGFCIKSACSNSSARCGFLRFLCVFVCRPVRKTPWIAAARTSCWCLCHLCLQPAGDYQPQLHLPLCPIGFSLLARSGPAFRGRRMTTAGWHTFWSKGERLLSLSDGNCNEEKMCGEKCLLPLPASSAVWALVSSALL